MTIHTSDSHFYYQPQLDSFAETNDRSELGMVFVTLLATIGLLALIIYSMSDMVTLDPSRARETHALEMITTTPQPHIIASND